MHYLEWENVTKHFGPISALSGADLAMSRGEIVSLLGPSGCGKTTFLRVTAGLESPDNGRILLSGRDLAGLPPNRRGMGLMFQDFLLFPHLDVAGNVGFGLRMQGLPLRRRLERIRETLEIVRLSGFEKRPIADISGGEKQRVALARSIAPSPSLLMLDEPLGALDAVLRGELLAEIPGILRKAGVTVLYVTHDQEEAVAVSDRVALMREGKIIQTGAPREIIENPTDAFAASFLKLGALVPVSVSDDTLKTAIGSFCVRDYLRAHEVPRDFGKGFLLIRPSAVKFSPDVGALPVVRARILTAVPHPGGVTLRIVLLGKDGARFELSVGWADGRDERFLPPPMDSELIVGVELDRTLLVKS